MRDIVPLSWLLERDEAAGPAGRSIFSLPTGWADERSTRYYFFLLSIAFKSAKGL